MTATEERSTPVTIDARAIEAVLDRLVTARGIAAAALFGPVGELVAARGLALVAAALGGEELSVLTALASSPSARFQAHPITSRSIGELTLVVMSERDVQVDVVDVNFHVSVAALAIRAGSRRPPPLRSDDVPSFNRGEES